MHMDLNETAILWPGRQKKKPDGFLIPTNLKILTIQEKPFVYVRTAEPRGLCHPDEIKCPLFNATDSGKRKYLLIYMIGT